MAHHLAAFPRQQHVGFFLEAVQPVRDPGDVRRGKPLGYALRLKCLIHVYQRSEILPDKRSQFQLSTLLRLHRNRFEQHLGDVIIRPIEQVKVQSGVEKSGAAEGVWSAAST